MTTGACLPPPERCERLAEMVARGGGTLSAPAGTAPVRVVYALPPHASAEIRDFWRDDTHAEFPPGYLARLPGGRVFGDGAVLAPDGGIVARDVSLDFGKPFARHWLLTYQKIRPPVPLAGTTAVIATNLGAGYAHWLLEELPRLLALPRDGIDTLIAHTNTAFGRDALKLRGWAGTVIEPRRFAHFACETLVIPSLVGTVEHPTPAMLAIIGEFVAPLARATPAGVGERIYITREGARRRRVSNEVALWATLESAGFIKLRLETLTWAEQIAAFRRARLVVGPHGAGLANLVFCTPGARVVEIFNRAYVNGCYGRLAGLAGLDYRPVVARTGEPLARTTRANRLDIDADLALVGAALR